MKIEVNSTGAVVRLGQEEAGGSRQGCDTRGRMIHIVIGLISLLELSAYCITSLMFQALLQS